MLYCAAMVDRQDASARLIAQLGGTSMGNILATLLDAFGPLASVGAQALYMLEPFFSAERRGWSELGHTLEDQESLEDLIRGLRGLGGDEF